MSRIPAIMLKEVHHIFRDVRTLFIIFIMPVMQLTIFGYAMNMELQDIKLGVYDADGSRESRELLQRFEHARSFYVSYPQDRDMHKLFEEGRYDAFLLIPERFGRDVNTHHSPQVQLIIDASDPNTATLLRNYCTGVLALYNKTESILPVRVQTSILYNPDMKSAFFIVPGLIAMILIMISALLTSIAITREKELGTMEQILVSPIKAHEIVIGKVLPYILLALTDALLILAVGKLLFNVPFNGSFLTFIIFTLLYVITALSLGLMISTIAKSQQTAMMAALTTTLLPTIMLSGFMFPIASMPKLLQYITYIVPAKYYLIMIRGIMLKGNTLMQLIQPALALTGMSLLMLTVAVRRFSLRLQ